MHPFEWSSPTREKDDRILELIPLEVYQEIFDYFHENDDMSSQEVTRILYNMRLVCRLFSAITLPRIFHHVKFSRRATSHRFCQALVNNQESANSLVQYVKSCSFAQWYNIDRGVGDRDSVLTMCCKALPKMVRVESVYFLYLDINKRIFEAVKSLPLIKSMALIRCGLAPDLDLVQFKRFLQSLRLQSFTALSSRTYIFSMAISPSFSFDALTTLDVDNWMIIQSLAEHHPVSSLEDLAIQEVVDLALLPALFSKMPGLLRLCICHLIGTHPNVLDSVHLTDNLIPKLSEFEGPPALAKLLVPCRPIRKVLSYGGFKDTEGEHPDSPSLKPQLWEALGKSTAPITELRIPEHLYHIGSIQKYVPHLAILTVTWSTPGYPYNRDIKSISLEGLRPLISKLCQHSPPITSIRQVTFHLEPLLYRRQDALLRLQLQHEFINTLILTAFPSVEQVNLAECVNWRRASRNDAWRANIPKGKRGTLFPEIRYCKSVLDADYGDCFKTFFDRNNPDYLDYAAE